MGDTKPGGLPSNVCAYCREPFASFRDMYSTAITIEAGGHAWKYAVPGPLHRQCCIAGAKQYRQRLIQPTVKDLCSLVSALDDAGKREVAKALGKRFVSGDQVYREFIPGYGAPCEICLKPQGEGCGTVGGVPDPNCPLCHGTGRVTKEGEVLP